MREGRRLWWSDECEGGGESSPVRMAGFVLRRAKAAQAAGAGGGANVLRLDEEDYVHHIDDAFTAQQMVSVWATRASPAVRSLRRAPELSSGDERVAIACRTALRRCPTRPSTSTA